MTELLDGPIAVGDQLLWRTTKRPIKMTVIKLERDFDDVLHVQLRGGFRGEHWVPEAEVRAHCDRVAPDAPRERMNSPFHKDQTTPRMWGDRSTDRHDFDDEW